MPRAFEPTTDPGLIRVASVPESHPYVRNLGWPGDGVVRLPDPMNENGRWWPPRMLRPDWVVRNAGDFDLFHVHFGFDADDPEFLREVTAALDEAGKPIVLTVHDLENPHHEDQGLHREQLAALMDAAAALITLTRRARFTIWREFAREAMVIPHPHVFPLDRLPEHRDPTPGEPLVVGLHFKSFRPNMIGLPMLEAATAAVEALGPETAVLRVNVHRELWDGLVPESARAEGLRRELETLDRAGRIDLRVHDYLADDEQFEEYIGGIDISVLPYAFGTHSGWLEACRDLGTAVVAPDCGCYSDQGTVFQYRVEGGRPDPGSVEAAFRAAAGNIRAFALEPLGPRFRESQRRRISRAHLDVYRSVLIAPERRLSSSGAARERG